MVIDEPGLRDLVGGRTVMVTGAGGSIGSELARQVFDLDPDVLVLLDRAEGPLYDIERELTLLADRDSETPHAPGPSPRAAGDPPGERRLARTRCAGSWRRTAR